MVEVVDTAAICETFPPLPVWLVERGNVLSAIEDRFADHQVVYITGQLGAGKTTLLAQFCRRTPKSLAAFLRPKSIGLTNPNLVRTEFYNQASFLLEGKEVPETGAPSEEDYMSIMLRLARRARQRLGRVVFVVDGFGDQTPEYQELLLKTILPTGIAPRDFRFLLSGESVPEIFSGTGIEPHIHELIGLSVHEAHHLLEDVLPDKEGRQRVIHSVASGHIGKLALVRKQIESGTPVEELLREGGEEYRRLLQDQLLRATESNPLAADILALLAFARLDYTVQELSAAVGKDANEVTSVLKTLGVVVETRIGWRLSSPLYQEIAQSQLSERQEEVTLRLAKLALGSGSHPPQYSLAVSYLSDSSRHDEILELVTGKSLATVARGEQNFLSAHELALVGAASARARANPTEEFRTRLLGSAAHALAHTTVLDTTIGALLGLGRFDRAYEIAATCPIIPERLALFALISREQQESQGAVSNDALEAIDQLLEPAAKAMPHDILAAVGANLFVATPAAAVRLAGLVSDSDDETKGDQLIAQMVLSAAPSQDPHRFAESLDVAISRTKSENMRSILSRFAQFANRKTLMSVLNDSASWDDDLAFIVLERIAPHLSELGAEAATKAIDRLASAVANASDELTPRIRAISDALAAARLAGVSNGLDRAIGRLHNVFAAKVASPTVDAISLDIELWALEIQLSGGTPPQPDHFGTKVESLLAIPDVVLQLDALGYLYLVATELAINELVPRESLRRLAHIVEEKAESVRNSTAYHDTNLNFAVSHIALVDLQLALRIASAANTRFRRHFLAEEAIKVHLESWRSSRECVDAALAKIAAEDAEARLDRLLEAATNSLNWAGAGQELYGAVGWLIGQVERLTLAESRVEHWSALGSVLEAFETDAEASDLEKLRKRVLGRFNDDIRNVDAPWIALEHLGNAGRYLCTDDTSREHVYKTAISLIDHERIHSLSLMRTYALGIQLAGSAIAAGIHLGLGSDSDLLRFSGAVARMPRAIDRVATWERLAARLYFDNRIDAMRAIVMEHLLPEIDATHEEKARMYNCIVVAFPAIYLLDSQLARQYLRRIPALYQEAAWPRVHETIRRRGSVTEPFTDRSTSLRLEYGDLIKLLDALEEVRIDAYIVHTISHIESSLFRYGDTLNQIQRREAVSRLNQIVEMHLPDPKGIEHDGYRIWAEALVERLDKRTLKGPVLDGLAKRARNIENKSDATFVLSILGSLASRSQDCEQLLNDAETLALMLPTAHERFERMCAIADAMITRNKARAQRILNDAWEVASSVHDEERLANYWRRALDLAYRVSPEFARELSEKLDGEKTAASRRKVERRRQVLDMRTFLLGQETQLDTTEVTGPLGAQAAFEALGLIRAKLAPEVRSAETIARTEYLLGSDLNESYPAAALFVHSIAHEHVKSGVRENSIRSVIDSMLDWLDFTYTAFGEVRGVQIPGPTQPIFHESADRVLTVLPGERAKLESFLGSWLIENAVSRIVLVDKYFGRGALYFLRICQEACPRVALHVIAGPEGAESTSGSGSFEEQLEAAWSSHYDGAPPRCTVHVVRQKGHRKGAIHDRFIFGDDAALTMGTSLNGFGTTISHIDATPTAIRQDFLERIFEPILAGETRIGNMALSVEKFVLGP